METPLIKELAASERPREKMMERGASALNDAELLAIFLRTGTPGRSAITVGAEMIAAASGSLVRLAQMPPQQLRKLSKGVGIAKACELAAAFEIGKRLARQTAQGEPLNTPLRIYNFLGPVLQHLPHESLRVILLNTQHHLIHEEEVSRGTLNESLAHPREILRPAISHGAYGFVLVHNHPSGDSRPSPADRALTRRIREAAELLQIHFLDHVIIGRTHNDIPPYFSFKEFGDL